MRESRVFISDMFTPQDTKFRLGGWREELFAAHHWQCSVLVDLVGFLASGPSIEKMLLNTVSLKTRMCRDKQSSR